MSISRSEVLKQIAGELVHWKKLGLTPAVIFDNPTSRALMMRRYRDLSSVLHPDKVPEELRVLTADAFKVIKDAYDYMIATYLPNRFAQEEGKVATCFGKEGRGSNRPYFAMIPYLIGFIYENKNFETITEEEQRLRVIAVERVQALPESLVSLIELAVEGKNRGAIGFFIQTRTGRSVLQTISLTALDRFIDIFPLLPVEEQDRLLAQKEVDNLIYHPVPVFDRLMPALSFKQREYLFQKSLKFRTLILREKQTHQRALELLGVSVACFKKFYFKQDAARQTMRALVKEIIENDAWVMSEKIHLLFAVKNFVQAPSVGKMREVETKLRWELNQAVTRLDDNRSIILRIIYKLLRFLGWLKDPLIEKTKQLINGYSSGQIQFDECVESSLGVVLEPIIPNRISSAMAMALAREEYATFWNALDSSDCLAILQSPPGIASLLEKKTPELQELIWMGLGQKWDAWRSNERILVRILQALPEASYPSFLKVVNIQNFAVLLNVFATVARSPSFSEIQKKHVFVYGVQHFNTEAVLSLLKRLPHSKLSDYLKIGKESRSTLLTEMLSCDHIGVTLNLFGSGARDYVNLVEMLGKPLIIETPVLLYNLFNAIEIAEFPLFIRALGYQEKGPDGRQVTVTGLAALLKLQDRLAYIINRLSGLKQEKLIDVAIQLELPFLLTMMSKLEPCGIKLALIQRHDRVQSSTLREQIIRSMGSQDDYFVRFMRAFSADSFKEGCRYIGTPRIAQELSRILPFLEPTVYPALIESLDRQTMFRNRRLSTLLLDMFQKEDVCVAWIGACRLTVKEVVVLLPEFPVDNRLKILHFIQKTNHTFLQDLSIGNKIQGVIDLLSERDQGTFLNQFSLDTRWEPLIGIMPPLKRKSCFICLVRYTNGLLPDETEAICSLIPLITTLYRKSKLSLEEIVALKPTQLSNTIKRLCSQFVDEVVPGLVQDCRELKRQAEQLFKSHSDGCRQPILLGLQTKSKLSFFSADGLIPKYKNAFLVVQENIARLFAEVAQAKTFITEGRTRGIVRISSLELEDPILKELEPLILEMDIYMRENATILATMTVLQESSKGPINCLEFVRGFLMNLRQCLSASLPTVAAVPATTSTASPEGASERKQEEPGARGSPGLGSSMPDVD